MANLPPATRRAIEAAEREIAERKANGGYAAQFAKWRDDPAGFQRDVLHRELWSKQVEVCESVTKYPVTVVPAGRACGKSFLLAGIVLWWLYTRPNSRVLTTGPDFRQVVSVLWNEMRLALGSRYDEHTGENLTSSIPLVYENLSRGYASPQRLKLGPRWEALGFASDTLTGFSGQHAKEQLVIVDEASGVGLPTWTGIDGSASLRKVICGNPITYECRFRELADLGESGSDTINVVRISSLDHPHADLEQSHYGAVSRAFLGEMRELHGEASPWWRSNILGLFPGQESTQFFPTAHVDACALPSILTDPAWVDHYETAPVVAVDVGGGVGADPSVIVVRTEKRLLEVFCSVWHGVLDDARHRLEPVVVDICRKYDVPGSRVTYDQAGLGRSLGSYLSAHGLPGAIGYYGAGKGGYKYVNRRSANAYALKRRLDPLRDGYVPFYCGGIPLWPQIRAELLAVRDAPMEYQEGHVKQRVEEKESLHSRIHHSPNLFDALIQSFTYDGD